jgi:hypothetical protein
MIAPIIETEAVIQAGDKIRIDASKSFVSKGEAAVLSVEIEPEAGSGYVTVTHADAKNWYLDWVYTGSTRNVVISCRVTVVGGANAIATKTIQVITFADDKLFSTDGDLIALEPDILKWVRKGRSSFLDVHRLAQKKILEWLDETGHRNEDGTKISKNELIDVSEVAPWSRDLALHLIFLGLSNQTGDVFMEKAKHYKSEAANRANRAVIAGDFNKDSVVDQGEQIDSIQSVVAVR